MMKSYKFVRDVIKSADDSTIIAIISQHNYLMAHGNWYSDFILEYESRVIKSEWHDVERSAWYVII